MMILEVLEGGRWGFGWLGGEQMVLPVGVERWSG